jgi:arylsulfatase A-like enzyme
MVMARPCVPKNAGRQRTPLLFSELARFDPSQATEDIDQRHKRRRRGETSVGRRRRHRGDTFVPAQSQPSKRPNFPQIERRLRLVISVLAVVATSLFEARCPVLGESPEAKRLKPNIVLILADDLGYGDLGCYGQRVIQTPHLDRMAVEGMRFTHFYAGATVCAPSRSVLMTGRHHGRTRVRGNAGKENPLAQALREGDLTVADVLHGAGYRTALIGKWGLGDVGPAECGLPRKHGFDSFFGFLNQRHAHNHYPDFLWRNEERVPIANEIVGVGGDGAGYATKANLYADDLFVDDAVRFVNENRERPFFLFWSMVVPHANNERSGALKDGAEVPDYGPYADRDWPNPDKGQAAMITRMDGYVGRLLAELKQLGLERNTLVVFSSDNGPHNESKHDLTRFQPAGPFRGTKRSLTDGGIRVPFIAWWPGTIASQTTSDHVGYFGDWMASAAELSGAATPDDCDSISFVPTLTGRSTEQREHEFLYWEFHERGFSQAALYQGRWKGIRERSPTGPLLLYDQQNDAAEQHDVAAAHPEIVAKLEAYLKSARSESPDWPIRAPSSTNKR